MAQLCRSEQIKHLLSHPVYVKRGHNETCILLDKLRCAAGIAKTYDGFSLQCGFQHYERKRIFSRWQQKNIRGIVVGINIPLLADEMNGVPQRHDLRLLAHHLDLIGPAADPNKVDGRGLGCFGYSERYV